EIIKTPAAVRTWHRQTAEYVRDIILEFNLTPSVVLLGLKYIGEICTTKAIPAKSLAMDRRIILLSMMLARKAHQDEIDDFYNNIVWSNWSGIPLEELNRQEREMLATLFYDVSMSREKFTKWVHELDRSYWVWAATQDHLWDQNEREVIPPKPTQPFTPKVAEPVIDLQPTDACGYARRELFPEVVAPKPTQPFSNMVTFLPSIHEQVVDYQVVAPQPLQPHVILPADSQQWANIRQEMSCEGLTAAVDDGCTFDTVLSVFSYLDV
ncbi:hypothetical protein HDV05_007231, partial [Chytridiales sp. JEL 0842]